jgi:transposase
MTKRIPVPSKSYCLELRRQMVEQGHSYEVIAAQEGVSKRTMQQWFSYHGLDGHIKTLRQQHREQTKLKDAMLAVIDEVPDASDAHVVEVMLGKGIQVDSAKIRHLRNCYGIPEYRQRIRQAIEELHTDFPSLTKFEVWETLRADGFRVGISTVYQNLRRLNERSAS